MAAARGRKVLAAALAAAALGCTFIVDNELSKPLGCDEIPLSDGSPGNTRLIHSGVTAPAFSGPAFPTLNRATTSFGSTLAFLRDGGLELAGGLEGDAIFFRAEDQFTPTAAFPAPGHEGPGYFGCSEVFTASYDSLRDRTEMRLIPGGCVDDSLFIDAGVYPGQPQLQAPALGWGQAADGGGVLAAVLGTQAQACGEVFPSPCIPPSSGTVPVAPSRLVSSLTAQDGSIVWIVATDSSVQLWNADFTKPIGGPVASGGPVRIAAVAADIGIAVRIFNGKLQSQLFDAAGQLVSVAANLDLGDPGAHGLELAHFGTAPLLRLAWLTGDGQARTATLDATSPAAQRLVGAANVCGSKGASFAAPTTTTTAAVLVGEALYFRHVK